MDGALLPQLASVGFIHGAEGTTDDSWLLGLLEQEDFGSLLLQQQGNEQQPLAQDGSMANVPPTQQGPAGQAPTELVGRASQGLGKRKSSSSAATRGSKEGPKTDPTQLEAHRRWRAKGKMQLQDLQATLDAKAAELARLSALNSALRRKQELLQSVVAIRDDQLRTLMTEQREGPQGPPVQQGLGGSSSNNIAVQAALAPTTAGCDCGGAPVAKAAGSTTGECAAQGHSQPVQATTGSSTYPHAQQHVSLQGGPEGPGLLAGALPGSLHAELMRQDPQGQAGPSVAAAAAAAAAVGLADGGDVVQMAGSCPPAPALDQPLPPLKAMPPVWQWDGAWVARLRHTSTEEWRAMWLEFVKEASMHVLAAEAHGPGSVAHDTLTQVVSHHLDVIDRITLLVPGVYYDSLYINLMTGERQQPPPPHWATVAKALAPTQQQVREAMTALESFDEAMAKVLAERSALAAHISSQLQHTPAPARTPPSHSASHPKAGQPVHMGDTTQLQASTAGHPWLNSGQRSHQTPPTNQPTLLHQVVSACSSVSQPQGVLHAPGLVTAAGPLPGALWEGQVPATEQQTPAVGGQAGGLEGSLPQGQAVLGGAGAASTPQLSSSCSQRGDLAHLTQQLARNVAKEHQAHDVVSDFLCTRVLSVVQLARAAAVSWPWLPDVTAILREGVAALGAQAAGE